MDNKFEIVSFYRFLNLDDALIINLRTSLQQMAAEQSLSGLIIFAPEGLNGMVAAPSGKLKFFTDFLLTHIDSGDWKFKYSSSDFPPFKRFSTKERSEIVSSGYPELFPDANDQSHLSPREWHEALSQHASTDENNGDYVLIDVRNDYEVALGTFKGAIDPRTSDFKEFPDFIESSEIPKDTTVFMCCTGGIRCEKAYLEMKQRGYETIYQLDGGILRYLEEYPEGLFEGECFVFDDRVALTKDLSPSQQYALCPHCGDPAKELISCGMCTIQMKVCDDCIKQEERKTCSKNCRYHYALRLRKSEMKDENKHVGKRSDNEPFKKNPVKGDSVKGNSGRGGNHSIMSYLLSLLLSQAVLLACEHNFHVLLADTDIAQCSLKPSEKLSSKCSLSEPEALVLTAFDSMKKAGNAAPLVDFIDWEELYNETPEKSREVMKVKNPGELANFYRRVLASPSGEINNLLESKVEDSLKKGKKDDKGLSSKAQAVLSKLRGRLEEKEREVKEKIQGSKYEIISSEITGDRAVVVVEQSYKDEKLKEDIKLHSKDGRWYISTISSVLAGSGVSK